MPFTRQQSALTRRLVAEGLDPTRNTRADASGPLRFMAAADGYVMARRPGCMPFVMQERDWLRLSERAA